MANVSAKSVAIGALVVFTMAVGGLCIFGQGFLHRLNVADATVEYVDLARQATEKRNYPLAEALYKQALIFARKQDRSGEDAGFVAREYAYFACNKLKNKKLAAQIEAEARKVPY